MRIIKYIFLLLLLGIIGISVYVATQKGSFDITDSTIINVKKSVLFNYVNDYKNWEDWSAWKDDDPSMVFKYPENTVGQNASYSWSGEQGNGKMTTFYVKVNDSIAQSINYGENESKSYISFKDTLGKTKITWRYKGTLNFMAKVYATFNGGVGQMMASMTERSLNNLNKVIIKEINTFDIKVDGIVQKPALFYIKKTTTCKTKEVENRLLIMLPQLINFFKKNNIKMYGSPFVIYESTDFANNTTTFSVCGPLREEIFFSVESDISTGKREAFSALKTTLYGDYSNKNKAKNKANTYLNENNLRENTSADRIEIFIKSASDVRYPSKWITELLIPLPTSTLKTAVAMAKQPNTTAQITLEEEKQPNTK